ncbi:MAG: tetratricopeptide repeat protein [Nitrospira defluvii]|nr:tetratricopeptide repeat protein [Nitrospira defluvii]
MTDGASSLTALFAASILAACSIAPVPGELSNSLTDAERTTQLQEAHLLHEQARSWWEDGRYREAGAPARKALAIREHILGSNHEDVAVALTTLGLTHSSLVELVEAKPLLERALAIRRSAFGSDDPRVGESLTNLAATLYAGGDFVKAIELLERSLDIRERVLGPSHPETGVTLGHLAIAQRGMSWLAQARSTADKAVTILRAADPPRPVDLAMALNVMGNVLGRLGKFEQARTYLQESLSLYEQTKGRDHPYVGAALIQLAMLEGKVGNYDGALPLLMRALAINERSYGSDNPEIAGNLYEIGLAERALGKTASARKRLERALEIQQAHIDPNHPFVASTLIELAEMKRQDGDQIGARTLLQRALRIQEGSLDRDHPSVAQTLTSLGYLEGQSNKFSSAEEFFSRAVKIRETALGPMHKDVARSLFDLARARHAQGHLSASRPLYERARQILQAQSAENAGLDDDAMSKIWKSDLKGLQDYAHMLAALARDAKQPAEQQSAISDAFVVAQEARGWLVQAAVAKSIAQRQVGSEKELGSAMQFEELRRKRQDLWARLNEIYGVPEGDRSTGEMAKLKQDLSQLQHSLDQASAQLRTQAPRYAELALPRPLDAKSVMSMLRSDEAVISFYTLGDRIQIWLLRSGKAMTYHETQVPRAKLVSLVEKVRSSIVPKQTGNNEGRGPLAYDVEAAAELYQLLFSSLERELAGVSQLFLAPDEALFPLPFAALLTDRSSKQFSYFAQMFRQGRIPAPRDLADYALLHWFVKSYTFAILPSISALKMLRQHVVAANGSKESFIGFGDPLLEGSGNERGGKMIAARGMRVAIDTLRRLDNLPGTREELLAVARALGVNPETNVFMNRRATEIEVRRLNSTGRLGGAKVLSFATHGLLAGELQGITQPALVLTPPEIATDENDGLLSMEDIFELKLHTTEWVILSACNTAGADGSGESLSGLSRAFFFAGAKALLVSQWSVDDGATKELMEQVFQRYSKVPPMPPTRALREGMLALFEEAASQTEKSYLAHPYAWAPFILVGDGGGSSFSSDPH